MLGSLRAFTKNELVKSGKFERPKTLFINKIMAKTAITIIIIMFLNGSLTRTIAKVPTIAKITIRSEPNAIQLVSQ
ncbi:hypothetical protein BVN1_36850 [Bacillus velezensis]|nr:hypothetical protein BVN1_36850 [Bacillus velezensis]